MKITLLLVYAVTVYHLVWGSFMCVLVVRRGTTPWYVRLQYAKYYIVFDLWYKPFLIFVLCGSIYGFVCTLLNGDVENDVNLIYKGFLWKETVHTISCLVSSFVYNVSFLVEFSIDYTTKRTFLPSLWHSNNAEVFSIIEFSTYYFRAFDKFK